MTILSIILITDKKKRKKKRLNENFLCFHYFKLQVFWPNYFKEMVILEKGFRCFHSFRDEKQLSKNKIASTFMPEEFLKEVS